jgi:hypothetical protein
MRREQVRLAAVPLPWHSLPGQVLSRDNEICSARGRNAFLPGHQQIGLGEPRHQMHRNNN